MKQKMMKLLLLLALLVPLPNAICAEVQESDESFVDIDMSDFDSASGLPETRGCNKKTKFKSICRLSVNCLIVNGTLALSGTLLVNGFNFSNPTAIATAIASSPGAASILAGAASSAGLGAVGAYGYIYNVGAGTVALQAPVNFDSNGPLLGITHTPSSPSIMVVKAGVYSITFSASTLESNQFAIFVNGVVQASTIYGSGAGTQQNTGIAILTLGAGDTITLVNHTSAGAVTLQTNAGGTATNVNASVRIIRLA